MVPLVGSASQATPCSSRQLSVADYRRLTDSLEVSEGRSPLADGYPELSGAKMEVRAGGTCVTVVGVDWDGELKGGVVVLDSAGRIVWADGNYHGARHLVNAGADRVLLAYTAGKGSGVYESRFVGLCALRIDTWVECYEAIARTSEVVSGSGVEESTGTDLSIERTATVEVKGDTVIWRGRVKYRRHGDRTTRDESLGTARTLLPR